MPKQPVNKFLIIGVIVLIWFTIRLLVVYHISFGKPPRRSLIPNVKQQYAKVLKQRRAF